jgi:hyperosmotically inducible periplasmic protein
MKLKLITAAITAAATLSVVTAHPAFAQSASPSTMGRSDQPVSDTAITTKVKASMAADTQVSARNINVTTVNGVVELRGTATSQSEVDKAVSIARGVDGVKSVTNSIQVAADNTRTADRNAAVTSNDRNAATIPSDRNTTGMGADADRTVRNPRADRN